MWRAYLYKRRVHLFEGEEGEEHYLVLSGVAHVLLRLTEQHGVPSDKGVLIDLKFNASTPGGYDRNGA